VGDIAHRDAGVDRHGDREQHPVGNELPEFLRFLTQQQLSELLHVSERTLERWRVEGHGPKFVRVGRRPLYRLADIGAWAEGQTFGSTSEAKR
jgi:Helix-turn-helix domain